MPGAGNVNLIAFTHMDDCNYAPAQPHQNVPDQRALSETIYASFESMLTPHQIGELYSMCLDDVGRRIRLLQETAAAQDVEAYRRAIHSVKGTCGMVGALRLAALATAMESATMPQPGDLQPYEEFLLASAELRRILILKSIPLSPSASPDTL